MGRSSPSGPEPSSPTSGGYRDADGDQPLRAALAVHVTLDWFTPGNGRIDRAFLLVGSTALLASLGLTIGLFGTVGPAV